MYFLLLSLHFEFLSLPLPPSENNLYINIKGRGGRVKGPGYRAYEAEYQAWEWEWFKPLRDASKILLENGSQPLSITLTFRFLYSQIYTLKGAVKKMDVSNRLKAPIDLLSRSLGIDDSSYFKVSCEKKTASLSGVDILITSL